MIRSKSVFVFVLVTLSAALSGCLPVGDPAGPGASGSVSLGKDVSPTGLKELRFRAIPDEGTPFDPAKPLFPATGTEGSDWFPQAEDLTGVTFPHPYTFSAVLGTTPTQHWRLFAWLSAGQTSVDPDTGEPESVEPKSGEPFGTTTFDVRHCGLAYGDYCGVSAGVDITIDKKVP